MCRHSEADLLAPGVCLNCGSETWWAWALIAFAALYILAQMIRARAFFAAMAGSVL